MNTTAKITNLLNIKPLTINELAIELGISRNSVHLQVGKLEAAGVLRKFRNKTPGGAGKPAYRYQTVAGSEDIHSTAYKPVADALMQTVCAEVSDQVRLDLLRKTGSALAEAAGLKPTNDLETDLQKSVDVVNSFGAMAELIRQDGKYSIRCHSCPVATLVHKEAMTCEMVAAFFSEASGKPVSVMCKREDTVVCGFAVSATWNLS